ncbi:hypothetical protein Pst134EB_012838 [Puccinia striiformis f. sp. tritici]|nr:hypothetical protein Pst134EB_012838 [Puccinia striiformis f. sp. tritici]
MTDEAACDHGVVVDPGLKIKRLDVGFEKSRPSLTHSRKKQARCIPNPKNTDKLSITTNRQQQGFFRTLDNTPVCTYIHTTERQSQPSYSYSTVLVLPVCSLVFPLAIPHRKSIQDLTSYPQQQQLFFSYTHHQWLIYPFPKLRKPLQYTYIHTTRAAFPYSLWFLSFKCIIVHSFLFSIRKSFFYSTTSNL